MFRSAAPSPHQPEKPAPDDRRAQERHARRLDMFWQFFGPGSAEKGAARVQDVSVTGVGMVVNRDFPPNTLLTIRLPTAAQGWYTCLVRVKHTHPTGPDAFQVGCVFIRPLSDTELRSLLI